MKIHFFQRYHSKENVDTANTMLMLSRLYTYSADKFFLMLKDLILCEKDSPELSFELQPAGKSSVPDAMFFQKSFKVVVETKLYNQFNQKQLENHLEKFGSEEVKVLLTIDPKPMDSNLKDKFEQYLEKYNGNLSKHKLKPIKHVNLTFEQLVNAMEDIVDERDIEIAAILDDYRSYCFDEGLIPSDYKWMRAVTVGETYEDNMKYGFYYDPSENGYSDHGYIGLYTNKAIRAIGKLKKTVLASYIDERWIIQAEKGASVTEDEIERIKDAINHGEEDHGYNLKTREHRYFIVDKFYQTDFKKTSKYGLMRSKFFNLGEMLKYNQMPETEQIAKDLNGRTWEEFN